MHPFAFILRTEKLRRAPGWELACEHNKELAICNITVGNILSDYKVLLHVMTNQELEILL